MSEPSGADAILSQAGEREKEFDWLGAAEFYEKALGSLWEMDSLKIGEVQERIGYASFRDAMQAESVGEFQDKLCKSVANYERAKEFYGRSSDSGKVPRTLRCDAMTAYLSYWQQIEVSEKQRLLEECWRLTKNALKAFEERGEAWEYGKTYNQLLSSSILGFTLDPDFRSREKKIAEARDLGVQAIEFLSHFDDTYELAKLYSKTAFCLGVFAYHFLDADVRESCYQRGLSYWRKAKELSEETAMIELLYPVFGGLILFGAEGSDEALRNLEKALKCGEKTKDKFVVGCALDWLVYHTAWKQHETEDIEKKKEFLERALKYSEDAKRQFSQISFKSPRCDFFWIEAPYAEYLMALANFETNLEKKRNLMDKAMKTTSDLLNQAENSGYLDAKLYADHLISNVVQGLAATETDHVEKNRLLEKALDHSNSALRLTEQLEPFLYWNRGVMQSSLAQITSELSELAKEPETKKKMLQEATLHEENSLTLRIKEVEFLEKQGSVPLSLISIVGDCQVHYGDFLNRLYSLTHNLEYLRKAVETFQGAIESLRKTSLISRLAECYWEMGQTYDKLGEHLRAAESFDFASKNYRDAIEKLPQLKDLYQDHALYMQAWSEIEKARHYHEREQYHLAAHHFETAANIHRSLKQWSYLTPNYAAWAQVEQAEELSRNEQSEDALKAFKRASQLFSETRKSLQGQFDKIENPREKEMTTNMLKATDLWREYCAARTALEEAKIFDKKGEHSSSSEKYDLAAGTLEKIVPALELEQERREFRFIISLARAWQKMTKAEAEGSPTLYGDAAQLFEEARELSPNEKTRMLALGHSRFCKALEAGSKFVDTGDPTIHVEAERFLEAAAKYYLNAGFQKASEYAKATRLLFDAYVSIDDGKKEKDPEKKARLYAMAEKILQTSAGSFMKAEHPEKREQVLRLLEEVQAERELATSLIELLHAPTIISSTSVFPSPTPTHEGAVGLENFANAEVQANLIARRKELKIGDRLDLEIELVNAGKGPAVLTKISEVVPEGFELREAPENYRAEDSYINMKGKRLDPLKTEELRLVLKPKVQGTFQLKPRIQYLDENGKYKFYEPEPITITVKELGIKGWLKGER